MTSFGWRDLCCLHFIVESWERTIRVLLAQINNYTLEKPHLTEFASNFSFFFFLELAAVPPSASGALGDCLVRLCQEQALSTRRKYMSTSL